MIFNRVYNIPCLPRDLKKSNKPVDLYFIETIRRLGQTLVARFCCIMTSFKVNYINPNLLKECFVYGYRTDFINIFTVTLKWPIYTFDDKYSNHFCENYLFIEIK